MWDAIVRSVLLIFVFLFGAYVGSEKPYPYEIIARLWQPSPSLTVYRFTDASVRETAPEPTNGARQLVFMTYGQSNAANFGGGTYLPKHDVVNFYENATYAYEDPALGGDGREASVWGRVGDKLIEAGHAERVVFALAGAGGRTAGQLATGEEYDYFAESYRALEEAYGKVDAILFHQGESNHRAFTGGDYTAQFEQLKKRMRTDGIGANFYLSRASFCGSTIDVELLRKQTEFIAPDEGIYAGPNTDLLSDEIFRADFECHFSAEGLAAVADMWVDTLEAGGALSPE